MNIEEHKDELFAFSFHPTQPVLPACRPTISMDLEKKLSSEKPVSVDVDEAAGVTEVLNASGHKQELERNFSLLNLCAIGITTGNVWAALGGSIVY